MNRDRAREVLAVLRLAGNLERLALKMDRGNGCTGCGGCGVLVGARASESEGLWWVSADLFLE